MLTRLDLSPYVTNCQKTQQFKETTSKDGCDTDKMPIPEGGGESSAVRDDIAEQSKLGLSSEGQNETLYDLYAVVNHHGGREHIPLLVTIRDIYTRFSFALQH
jgi:hypothetical protein